MLNRIIRLITSRRRGQVSSAFLHNQLENVDTLNRDMNHWLTSREQDKAFIDKIYDTLVTQCAFDKGRVADFGCGTGVLVSKLKTDFPELSVVGYDFSAEKIENCKEHYDLAAACFEQRDIYETISDPYDVIIATEVLEHLEHPMRATRNLLNGLAPSGRLFLTVPDGRKDSFAGHIHFWSPESWSLFIEEAVGDSATATVGHLHDKNYALVTSPATAGQA